MSDKKMNDFPTAADGAFVYAEDANGNQIKISKADLASVVAGLLGVKQIEIKIAPGADYIIQNSNVKAIVLLTFAGTNVLSLSVWHRNTLSSIIAEHQYYSIGTTTEGTLCLNKNGSNNFVISNKMDTETTVRIGMIHLF